MDRDHFEVEPLTPLVTDADGSSSAPVAQQPSPAGYSSTGTLSSTAGVVGATTVADANYASGDAGTGEDQPWCKLQFLINSY